MRRFGFIDQYRLPELPLEIQLLILQLSGHVAFGDRTLRWIVYF